MNEFDYQFIPLNDIHMDNSIQRNVKYNARQIADEFWEEIEAEAAKLEVTIDYYLEEFYC